MMKDRNKKRSKNESNNKTKEKKIKSRKTKLPIFSGYVFIAIWTIVVFYEAWTLDDHHGDLVVDNNDRMLSNEIPQKIYTVIGKESSGTKFVSFMLRDALKLHRFREGQRPYEFVPKSKRKRHGTETNQTRELLQHLRDHVSKKHVNVVQLRHEIQERREQAKRIRGERIRGERIRGRDVTNTLHPKHHRTHRQNELEPIQVQHFSLPQMGNCNKRNKTKTFHPQIIDIVLPSICYSSRVMDPQSSSMKQCKAWKREGNNVEIDGRFFLNMTSNKHWYDSHNGTEQYYIIVVRNEDYSFQSRIHSHCGKIEQARLEERIANGILNDAIRSFLLQQPIHHDEAISTGGNFWQANHSRDRIWMEDELLWNSEHEIIYDGDDILYSSLIPFRNNVALVSYEKMMQRQGDFVQELFQLLGIESNHTPKFVDGNAKYKNIEKDDNTQNFGAEDDNKEEDDEEDEDTDEISKY